MSRPPYPGTTLSIMSIPSLNLNWTWNLATAQYVSAGLSAQVLPTSDILHFLLNGSRPMVSPRSPICFVRFLHGLRDLNKRCNAICYHRVREAQAAGMIRVGWIEGEKNVADLFTKTTLSNESKRKFVQLIFDDNSTPLPWRRFLLAKYLLAEP